RAAQRHKATTVARPALPTEAETPDPSMARARHGVLPATAIGADSGTSEQTPAADTGPKHFLRRHGRLILLGVSLVVLALLTVNLVSQRQVDEAGARAAATPGTTGALAVPLARKPARAVDGQAQPARIIPIAGGMAV